MNEKKKLAILIALAVAILGVGAFQFANLSSTEKAPAPTAKKSEEKKSETPAAEEQPDAMRQLIALSATPRDPFQEGTLAALENQPPAQPTPPTSAAPKVRRPSGELRIPPFALGGEFPTLPGAGGVSVTPSEPVRNPDAFGFSVSGVITGARPAAVFVDENGNQRLVTVGSSLDGDSQLVGVEKGRVIVRHKGKTKTLTVGGTPNEK
jgi:hypothetical protein